MKRILVIDDVEEMISTVRMGLERNGHKVSAATDMAGSVKALQTEGPFDILLLDMQGGDIDRQQISKAARAMGIRVITMSGDPAMRPQLDKPFQMADLEAAIRA